MKKKLLAILTVLVICLTPAFMLVGCGSEDPNNRISLTCTSWKVEVGQSFSSSKVEGLEILYDLTEFNPDVGKYQYLVPTKEGKMQDPKKFSPDLPEDQFKIDDFAEACTNGLRDVEGFDSSTAVTGKTMTVMIFGVSFTVTYDVVEKIA